MSYLSFAQDLVKPDKNFHLYILIGQSNMAGRGTLTDSLGTYKSEDLTNSLDKMIHQDIYKNYFSRMEGESYWIEVIQKEEKYYLVVALN